MLDAHQLNVFIIAAETLNFTQAAQSLHMSQPSVSQHIQALERHFGTPLFIRAGRNLALTDAGLALIPQAREMVNLSIHTEEMMASLHGDVFGHISIGCSTTPGEYFLPNLMADFHKKYAQVKVTCGPYPRAQVLRMLYDGNVHFALIADSHDLCKGAEFRKFAVDQVVLAVPIDHPLAAHEEIEPEELYHTDFILLEDPSGTHATIRESMAKLGINIDHLNILLTLGKAEALVFAVQEGLGVGFVSQTVIEKLSPSRVRPVRVRGAKMAMDLYIGRNSFRPTSIAQTIFWEFMLSMQNRMLSSSGSLAPVKVLTEPG
jgi:DNA-binding transcriptional LysR family regulator